MTRILITGADGQVGHALQMMAPKHLELIACNRAQFDLTDPAQMKDHIKTTRPDVIVNCAAFTAVDLAETEKENAFAVNATGVEQLAILCQQHTVPLIHLSTDYVFSGENHSPYLETDAVNPTNYYGESKLAGELAIQKHLSEYIILRTSGVFHTHGHNFVKTILRLAQTRKELRIVADQTICPTYAPTIAMVIFKIIETLRIQKEKPLWGTYHFCNSPATTWFDFTVKIVELAKKSMNISVEKIVPIATHEYPTPAKRPAYSVLNCGPLISNFDIPLESWETGLVDFFKKLLPK